MQVRLKPHPTIAKLYATRDGRLFFEATATASSGGYHVIHIGRQSIRRHTLVLQTFRGLAPPGMEARHLDGNPGNDHASNLRWSTRAVNMHDTIRHGTSTRGERNARAKLTEQQAREIMRRRKAGETGKGLADEFRVSQATICDLTKGRTWPGIR